MTPDWTGQTCCIIASGPSLTQEDVDFARENFDRIIVINETWRLCPTADALYGADEEWWIQRGPSPDQFQGELLSINLKKSTNFPPHVVRLDGEYSEVIAFEGPLTTGLNSSFQALQIAMRRGCRKIAFLGLDMGYDEDRKHWHGDHGSGLRNPSESLLGRFRICFENAARPLLEHGYIVINASRRSALDNYPKMSIHAAIEYLRNCHDPEIQEQTSP